MMFGMFALYIAIRRASTMNPLVATNSNMPRSSSAMGPKLAKTIGTSRMTWDSDGATMVT